MNARETPIEAARRYWAEQSVDLDGLSVNGRQASNDPTAAPAAR